MMKQWYRRFDWNSWPFFLYLFIDLRSWVLFFSVDWGVWDGGLQWRLGVDVLCFRVVYARPLSVNRRLYERKT